MGKKMKTLMLIILSVTLASCAYFESKVLPKAKEAASKSITGAIVKEGQCANVEAVKADVDKLLKIESDESVVVKAIAEAEEVQVSQKSVAASEKLVSKLCKSAFGLAVPALLSKGVPQAWGCSLVDLGSKLDLLAAKACDKI
jgi:hypothetical protein